MVKGYVPDELQTRRPGKPRELSNYAYACRKTEEARSVWQRVLRASDAHRGSGYERRAV